MLQSESDLSEAGNAAPTVRPEAVGVVPNIEMAAPPPRAGHTLPTQSTLRGSTARPASATATVRRWRLPSKFEDLDDPGGFMASAMPQVGDCRDRAARIHPTRARHVQNPEKRISMPP